MSISHADMGPIPCPEDQLDEAINTRSHAEEIIKLTLEDLSDPDKEILVSNLLYKLLGARSSSDRNDIIKIYKKMEFWISNVTFLCYSSSGGDEPVYAEVFPDDPLLVIYLGSEFWDADDTGLDSKPGVIIHEISHFLFSGATNFHYGEHTRTIEEVIELSKNNPKAAKENANGYEYFSEALIFSLDEEILD